MKLVLAICALASCSSAFALGPRYTENFNDNVADSWATSDPAHPWLVTSGYYYNEDLVGSVNSTFALYDPAIEWENNFALTLRMFADYPAAANRVGVILGYMSPGNYYEVLASPAGQVTVTRFVSGNASWTAAGTVTAFPADTFVPVEVILMSGKLSVRINGAPTAFANPGGGTQSNVTLPAVNLGQIGLVARSNFGRFDDISVVNLFFRTSFSGAQLGDPRGSNGGDTCTTTCWQDVTGQDTVYPDQQWPFRIYGMEGQFQLLADANPLSSSTVGQYLHNEIQTVIGHAGTSTAALYQHVAQRGNDDGGATQDPLIFRWLGSAASQPAQGDFYVRFWIKLQPEFPANLVDGWRMFFQWKDGSDYRLSLNMITSESRTHDNIPIWNLVADNQATQQTKVIYFNLFRPTTVPSEIPTGWFKFEFFQRRNPADLNDFRAWVAINGVTIFNVTEPDDGGITGNGQYTGDYTKISRIMLPQLYWGTWPEGDVDVPVYQWVDDIEVWDGFPPSASSH
jgi:hypothetical protein